MANQPVIPFPAVLDLPISNHGDFFARFVYKPVVVDVNGEPVLSNGRYQFVVADYPVGASISLIIDTDPEIVRDSNDAPTADGYMTITGSVAEVLIDKAITATIGIGSTWSLVLSFADGFNKPIMEGKTVLTQRMVTK